MKGPWPIRSHFFRTIDILDVGESAWIWNHGNYRVTLRATTAVTRYPDTMKHKRFKGSVYTAVSNNRVDDTAKLVRITRIL